MKEESPGKQDSLTTPNPCFPATVDPTLSLPSTSLRLSEADEIEVTAPPGLTDEQETLVDLHSVLNLLAVLASCLELLDLELEGALGPLRDRVEQAATTVQDHAAQGMPVSLDSALVPVIEAGLEAALDATRAQDPSGTSAARTAEIAELSSTIRAILRTFEVRAAELLARSGRFHEWIRFDNATLLASLHQVLAVIQQNARGQYRIVRNIAQQSPSDYYVQASITSDDGTGLRMPAVLQDVLRDLVANGRKYTPPGGRILAGLHASSWGIRVVVEDTGIGIPRDELELVTRFGYRASNARGRRTMGGGFGLTKAHWVASQFGGRLWLRSREGIGTRVTILIPAPTQPPHGPLPPPDAPSLQVPASLGHPSV